MYAFSYQFEISMVCHTYLPVLFAWILIKDSALSVDSDSDYLAAKTDLLKPHLQ